MDDAELQEIKQAARRNRMTVAEWVRLALRAARRREAPPSTDRKLQVVREAARHRYPAGEIDDMLADIDRGYTQESG